MLDPQQHPKVWTKNENDQWHRVDRPTKYLSKVEDSDSQESCETDSSDDDPSYYLERAVRRLPVGQDDSNDKSGLGPTGISLLQGPVQK